MDWFSSFSRNGLIYRWIVINILWASLVGAAYSFGWLQYIFTKDETFITHGIVLAFLPVLILTLRKALRLNGLFKRTSELSATYHKAASLADRTDVREALKNKLMASNAAISFSASALLAVGVLGTVTGLIIGFSDVTPQAVSDATNAAPTVATLLKGLSVAFHTTLVGGICNLWLLCNNFILNQASAILFAKIVEKN